MNRIMLSLLLIGISSLSFCQNSPVPEYLVTQQFPDSVRSLSLARLSGENVAFGQLLETHKGKKVVIDIWASWCGDCLVSLPDFDGLRKSTGEEKVAYVFISVDTDTLKWKMAIQRFNIQGDHYRIETGWKNTLSNYINLDWIPRYLLLDESGMVLVPNALKPTDKNLKHALAQ